jgi:hypothetical protein
MDMHITQNHHRLDSRSWLLLALNPDRILQAQHLTPDPWQHTFLLSTDREILLNCSRQSGKSTTVAALAVHTALCRPRSLILLLSPTLRQSGELFRKVVEGYQAIGRPVPAVGASQTQLELANGSRVVSLPGNEETVRSFSGVALLVLDEAARVPDDLYRAVRPMLAVSQGRLICLSTPFGRRGFFWREWADRDAPWQRVRITWHDCARITPAFIAREHRASGPSWVRQEYECCFEALEGLVYPTFETCIVGENDKVTRWQGDKVNEDDKVTRCQGDKVSGSGTVTLSPSHLVTLSSAPSHPVTLSSVGGIDFGYRNPFAALWGHVDADGVLWITGERYASGQTVHDHAVHLPKGVTWYADPAGAAEIATLRRLGVVVRKGDNDIRAGIAAVRARLETGMLQVVRERCPNLIAEAQLYRYPEHAEGEADSEIPIDAHNHALAALRYLVARLDYQFIARFRRYVSPTRERGSCPPQ